MATTAWKTAATFNDLNDGMTGWDGPTGMTAPQTVASSDDNPMYCQIFKRGDTTSGLEFSNFAFNSSDIPDGATIDGVEVLIERRADYPATDTSLTLHGVTGSPANMATATIYTTSDAPELHGSPTSKWGYGTIPLNDVRNPNFMVRYYAISAFDDINYVYVDYLAVRVHYTAPGGEPAPATRARRSSMML